MVSCAHENSSPVDMRHQLIITILGQDKPGILSRLATAVSEIGCNILDSRQAKYGQDFSLTMILEGNQSAITKAEIKLPMLSQELDVLAMMKRTSQHTKQNMTRLCDFEFEGVDQSGVIKQLTQFFASQDVDINAFRQKTFTNQDTQDEMVHCKMVINLPAELEFEQFETHLQHELEALSLAGKVTEKHI